VATYEGVEEILSTLGASSNDRKDDGQREYLDRSGTSLATASA